MSKLALVSLGEGRGGDWKVNVTITVIGLRLAARREQFGCQFTRIPGDNSACEAAPGEMKYTAAAAAAHCKKSEG